MFLDAFLKGFKDCKNVCQAFTLQVLDTLQGLDSIVLDLIGDAEGEGASFLAVEAGADTVSKTKVRSDCAPKAKARASADLATPHEGS